MSSNLPPGVKERMIPGNRAEDQEWEEFHEEVDKDIKYYGMSPDDANKAWSYGLGAWYYVHKGS